MPTDTIPYNKYGQVFAPFLFDSRCKQYWENFFDESQWELVQSRFITDENIKRKINFAAWVCTYRELSKELMKDKHDTQLAFKDVAVCDILFDSQPPQRPSKSDECKTKSKQFEDAWNKCVLPFCKRMETIKDMLHGIEPGSAPAAADATTRSQTTLQYIISVHEKLGNIGFAKGEYYKMFMFAAENDYEEHNFPPLLEANKYHEQVEKFRDVFKSPAARGYYQSSMDSDGESSDDTETDEDEESDTDVYSDVE